MMMLTLNGLLGVHVALQTDNQFRVTPPLPNGSSNPCDPKKDSADSESGHMTVM